MKILFSAETLYPYLGGADISARTLLEELAKKHEVYAVYIGDHFKTNIKIYPQKVKKFKGFWIRSYFLNKKWKKILEYYIKTIKPDLVITQDSLIPSTIKLANKYNLTSVVFLRNYHHLSINGFLPNASKKYLLQYPFFKLMFYKQKKALEQATFVFSNSNFMKKLTKYKLNIDSKVIYPFVNLNKYKTKPKGNYITLINPDTHKGLDIFKKLAKLLPNKKFFGVGKIVPGIESTSWTNDMKSIYKKTRILIAPSTWPEPFGRMCVEAMISGIPCIVSNKGGLPEVIGDAGIVANNLREWIAAIKKLDNKEEYNKLSKKARIQAKKFDFKIQFKKFISYINKHHI